MDVSYFVFMNAFFSDLLPSAGPDEGEAAPDFTASVAGGGKLKLSDLRGSWVVLYFFPRASSPSCTRESCSLRDGYDELKDLNAVVVGVSLDQPKTLERFKEDHALPFDLVTDIDKTVTRAYGALAPAGLFALRMTYLIDPTGKIAKVFNTVDAREHHQEVRTALEALQCET